MKLPHVKLQPDDGKHHDGEEEEQTDLKQGHHRLHDGLEDDLQACGDKEKHIISEGRKTRAWGWGQGRREGLSKGKFRVGNTKQCCFSQGAIKKMLQP